MELEQRSSKPWAEGSNPSWDALPEMIVATIFRQAKVSGLVYVCGFMDSDDGDESLTSPK